MSKPNIILRNLMKDEKATKMVAFWRKELLVQWRDFIYSEAFDNLYARYKSVTFKKSTDDDDKKLPVIPLAGALLVIRSAVRNRLKPLKSLSLVGGINQIQEKMFGYLNSVANKGGQYIIDLIKGIPKKLKFRLSRRDQKMAIRSRTATLLNDLDETTTKLLTERIGDILGENISKSEALTRLDDIGSDIARVRSERIVLTETLAAYEFMKQEAATMNGFSMKTWEVLGSNACPICLAADGETIELSETFSTGVLFPPAHPNCECAVEYTSPENIYCSDVEKSSKQDTIKNTFGKVFDDYEGSSEYQLNACINPNAVWAGGESLVGADKNVGNIFKDIFNEDLPKTLSSIDSDVLDIIAEEKLKAAKIDLTPPGFVQLTRRLGYNSKGKLK